MTMDTINLERSLVYALVHGFEDVTDILKAEDFVNNQFRTTFEVLNRLHGDYDMTVLSHDLGEAGIEDPLQFLTGLHVSGDLPSMPRQLAKRLRSAVLRRNYTMQLQEALSLVQTDVPLEQLPSVEIGHTFNDVKNEIIKPIQAEAQMEAYIENQDKLLGKQTPIRGVNKLFGGIRLAEYTIITGHTGRGKTTAGGNLVEWAEKAGFKCLIMSFEMKLASLIKKQVEISTGKSVFQYSAVDQKYYMAMPKDSFYVNLALLSGRDIWFLDKDRYSQKGYYDIDRMESVVRFATENLGINFFLIDHLHYFLKVSDARNPVYKIDETIRQINTWKTKYNCHIILIVHPHSTQDNTRGESAKLGLNSLKGSAAIAQEADNVIVVESKKDGDACYAKWRVLKNREFGKLGDIEFAMADNLNTYNEVIDESQDFVS